MSEAQLADNARQIHNRENDRAARAAHALMSRPDYSLESLYVYFAPYRLEAFYGSTPPDPAVWSLAWPERVPGNLTADQLVAWFAARSARVPYLIDAPKLFATESYPFAAGQRFDKFGQTFEVMKAGRDKARTITLARRVRDSFGKEGLIDQFSTPAAKVAGWYLRPL